MNTVAIDERALADLARRWERARLAALRTVVASETSDERTLARDALIADEALTLRKVFDHSLALGRSFARFHDVVLEVDDLASLVQRFDASCSNRRQARDASQVSLTRGPCASGGALCRYYREAIDGLVTGSSDGDVCFRRHRSSDDGVCLDVLFAQQDATDGLRYGPIPDDMTASLQRLARRLVGMPGIAVTFRGYSSGTLFYEARATSPDLAADRVVSDAVARCFPHVKAQSTAPRAVISET